MPITNNTLKLKTIAGANIKTNIVYTLFRKYPKKLNEKFPKYLREAEKDAKRDQGKERSAETILGESLYAHFIDWILFFDVDFSSIALQLKQDREHGYF